MNKYNKQMNLIEFNLRQLEQIAQTWDTNSPQYMSIRMAATALLFVHANDLVDHFDEYCSSLNETLTEEQTTFLRKHDIRK